jgi:hypothetical protein
MFDVTIKRNGRRQHFQFTKEELEELVAGGENALKDREYTKTKAG